VEQEYTEINSKAIDSWIKDGWEWGIPIPHEEYINAGNGQWSVVLTPQRAVPAEWFEPFIKNGKLSGVKLLGLASGGGQQMPIFAALGADCTVLDNSDRQLESERMVSEREGYSIRILKADMTKRLPFDDEAFDIIFHPISNCYIEDVYPVWNECFRILKKGGILLSGLINEICYLTDEGNPLLIVNKLPYNPLKDEKLYEKCVRETEGSIQFSHSLEEQIGGQLKAGFILNALYEDRDTDLLSEYTPLYFATRAMKPESFL